MSRIGGVFFQWISGTPTRDASLEIRDQASNAERLLVVFRGEWGAFGQEAKERLLAALFCDQPTDQECLDLAQQVASWLVSVGAPPLGSARDLLLRKIEATLRKLALAGAAEGDTLRLARLRRVLAYIVKRSKGFAITDLDVAAEDLDLSVVVEPAGNGVPTRVLQDSASVIAGLEAEARKYRDRAEALSSLARGDQWIWQDAGGNELESLGATVAVVISAGSLRELIAAARGGA